MLSMNRVNQIVDNADYMSYMKKIEESEKERCYCRHGFEHGLDVARIAYAYILERGELLLSKEGIYAAALLHDIGRWVEYETGEDHAEVSARLALPLLEVCDFSSEDIQVIIKGIREHRRHHDRNLTLLGEALAKADNYSRDCRHCTMQKQCHKFKPEMKQIWY